ncbi:PQQ-binding-like beta-propeller repeat protein [Streptomyces sp. MAR4 CNX-425]|uniref:outer membrane protein assembly factor BamB family protein n=1 Tax=Streptomyces sp. MAR4 CNX-425 TaxID=3406343 RepID=UPI003B5020EC
MEPLRLDDPEQFGAYRPVGRLDPDSGGLGAPAVRYVAQAPGGVRTVLVTAPRAEATAADHGHAGRFHAAAAEAQRLAGTGGPWLAPVGELSAAGPPWWAMPYRPALPLPAALDAQLEPLPERTVYAVGAALAETLAALHAAGVAHGGLDPTAVLLTGDGPLLTGYGAVGAAGADGSPRAGLAGLIPEFLPPEQAAGGRPRPLGDVYALAAVLVYAATGRAPGDPAAQAAADPLTDPYAGGPAYGADPYAQDPYATEAHGAPGDPLDLLSPALRGTLEPCLRADPAGRPTAAALLPELLRGAAPGAGQGPGAAAAPGTVLDAATTRSGAALAPGWLPRRVSAALARQAADVLAAETEPDPDFLAAPEPGAVEPIGATTVIGRPGTRRALLAGIAGGAVGVAAGGAAAWAATTEDPPPPPTTAERLAARNTRRKRFTGAPPTVLWGKGLGKVDPVGPPVVAGGGTALVVAKSGVYAMDLRTGDELWEQPDVRPAGGAVPLGDGMVLVPGKDLAVLDTADGAVAWTSEKFRKGGRSPYRSLLGVAGDTAAFTVEEGGELTVVGYDLAERRELWRSPGTAAATAALFLGDSVLLVPEADENAEHRDAPAAVSALDLASGAERWAQEYDGMAGGHWAAAGAGVLVATAGKTMRGYDAGGDGAELWNVAAEPWSDEESNPQNFGPPAVQGRMIHALDTFRAVHTVARDSGEEQWKRNPQLAYVGVLVQAPALHLTPDERFLIAGDDMQVLAYDVQGGDLLWRFTDMRPGKPKYAHRRRVAVGKDTAVVASGSSVYALPLD